MGEEYRNEPFYVYDIGWIYLVPDGCRSCPHVRAVMLNNAIKYSLTQLLIGHFMNLQLSAV